jgi:Cdc6-like AAA superfamily ATPase
MEEQTRYIYLAQINLAFTPGAPIDSRNLFAGRTKQVDKLVATVFQKGSHAILFGEPGVGKTSLANTLFDFLVFTGEFKYQRARLNCADGMTFTEIWRAIFKQFTFQDPEGVTLTLDEAMPESPHSENIRETFQLLDYPTIVIIDELNRISDQNTKTMLADTIKTLSDNAINTTLILVGVAESVTQLIGEHHSIERALVQVAMNRMSKGELMEIVNKGLNACPGPQQQRSPLNIDAGVRERIADYSQGLPFYTHLLAREAATAAVQAGRTNIIMADLETAIKEAVEVHLESHLMMYNTAVTAPRGKYFKPVLLACALAPKDEKGFFYATNIVQPLEAITGKRYEIPAFSQHLKDFSETRGPILERDKRRYRFINPMMAPFVILRGLADELIKETQLSRPPATSNELGQLSLLSGVSAPPIEL